MPINLRKPKHKPQIDYYESDLGEPNGRWQTENAKKAKYAAAVQTVFAIGRRTQDWMKRDLLSGSSGDDRRNWFQRQVLKYNPQFLVQEGDHILPSQMTVVREARAFDYMNRHRLYGLAESLRSGSAEWRAAAAAAVCPTSLYQTADRIPHRFGFARNTQRCRNNAACPHCYARTMVKRFASAACLLKQEPPEFIALFSRSSLVDFTDSDRFHQLRLAMREELTGLAKSAGGAGGLWSQQLAPVLSSEEYWSGDDFKVNALAALELRVAVMAVIPCTGQSLQRLQEFSARRDSIEKATEIDVQRFDIKRSLRSVFVRGRDLSTTPTKLQENSHGLFYWPPVSVSSPSQWVSRFYLMRNQPVVRLWGSWSLQSSDMDSLNHTTEQSTPHTHWQRRVQLLRAAEPILLNHGFPNNPLPGRVKLRKQLLGAGIHASERDVRWLISHLS